MQNENLKLKINKLKKCLNFQLSIFNFQTIFPPKEDLPSADNFKIFKR